MKTYDEEQVLRSYVINSYGHLMTALEKQVVGGALWLLKSKEDNRQILQKKLNTRFSDQAVRDVLELGHSGAQQWVVDRLLDRSGESIFVNRCPQCRKIVATPKARQCLWCGHDWH